MPFLIHTASNNIMSSRHARDGNDLMGESTFLKMGDDFIRNFYVRSRSAQRVYLRSIQRCIELIRPVPGMKILDVGCGTGILLSRLPDDCRRVGVDISLEMLNDAKKRFPEILFIQADMGRLPFRRGVFDSVTCRAVIQHLEKPEASLSQIRMLLRPRGSLVSFVPVFWFPAALPRWIAAFFMRKAPGIRGHEYRVNELMAMMAEKQFRVTASRRWGSLFYMLSGYGTGLVLPFSESPFWERLIDLDELIPGGINLLMRAESEQSVSR